MGPGSQLTVSVTDIADGRGGPLPVAKLPAEHAWLLVGSAQGSVGSPSTSCLPLEEQLLGAWRHGYSPGETEDAGVGAPCLQGTGDSPKVVSVAGEVQAAPTWRDNREALWVRHSGKALAGWVRLRPSLGRVTGYDSAWDTGIFVI